MAAEEEVEEVVVVGEANAAPEVVAGMEDEDAEDEDEEKGAKIDSTNTDTTTPRWAAP